MMTRSYPYIDNPTKLPAMDATCKIGIAHYPQEHFPSTGQKALKQAGSSTLRNRVR
jgi:hypothetical protein